MGLEVQGEALIPCGGMRKCLRGLGAAGRSRHALHNSGSHEAACRACRVEVILAGPIHGNCIIRAFGKGFIQGGYQGTGLFFGGLLLGNISWRGINCLYKA